MGGSFIQLKARGKLDAYITENPEITFFKTIFKRHTNFSFETMEHPIQGMPEFGGTISCQISKHSDLVHQCWLKVKLSGYTISSGLWSWVEDLNYALIKSATVKIGGHVIDHQTGEFMYIDYKLSKKHDLIAPEPVYQQTHNGLDVWVPLRFWFCKDVGNSIPLIALDHHEVRIEIEFSKLSEIASKIASTNSTNGVYDDSVTVLNDGPKILQASMFVDVIHLDSEERKQYARSFHETLIEQVQIMDDEKVNNINKGLIKLPFQHLVKELYFVFQREDLVADPFLYTQQTPRNKVHEGGSRMAKINKTPLDKLQVQVNGLEYIPEFDGDYFHYLQPYFRHSNIPRFGIHTLSFGLEPEKHQPSGVLNMSRLDEARMIFRMKYSDTPNIKAKIYAKNYNVLRIGEGMAGLAFVS